MAGLPAALLRHTLTIEPFLGSSGRGPAFGPPRSWPCFIEPVRSTQRGAVLGERTGNATAMVYAPLDTPVTTEDRVTVEGRVVQVMKIDRHNGGGLPTPDHLEITVQ